jgi:Cu(I)/Ag(I) efflux system membrane fusion protein
VTSKPSALLFVLLIGLGAGFAIAVYLQERGGPDPAPTGPNAQRKILYWVAPMDPNFRRDRPGKSPMDMDLVPVYDEPGAVPGGDVVVIGPEVVNNVGVRTAEAKIEQLNVPVRTVGRVTFDEEKVAHIHLRSNGWIQRLSVRAEGEPVSKGDLLFEVYSPELVKAQSEYVQALKSDRQSLISASRDRLRALGISGGQIRALEQDRAVKQYVRFFSPITGVVTALNVADGKHVTPDTDVMALADLSAVWLISDVFETQTDQLRIGAAVTAQSKFDPGAVIEGKVDYIYPDLDAVTRTVPVRTVLENTHGLLKPGMFMTVAIEGPDRPPSVVVPREALIRTGREERIILALGEGRFRPAKVSSGKEAAGKVEILSGLAAGEIVVVSGQFLIDSESSFTGASLRLGPESGSAP